MIISHGKIPAFTVSVLLHLAAPVSAQEQVVDRIAAVVGDEIILKSEVDQYSQEQAVRMRIDPYRNKRAFQNLWTQTLETLIDQKILLERAKLDSIEVSDREVDDALDQQIDGFIQRFGSQEKAEELIGFSLNKLRRLYRNNIKNRLLVDKIQAEKFRDISVNRREVEEFYEEFGDSLPELKPAVNISHILMEVKPGTSADSLAKAKADSILKLLRAGADFAELATENSQDPSSALRGGELGFMKRGSLVLEYEEVAYSLEPGEISDIVKTEFGYHIIKLIERRGERINTQHILVMPGPSSNDEQRTITALNDIRNKIIEGENFSKFALEFSDDPEVTINSGELGWFEIESLNIPEFRTVLDSLPVDSISVPFKTSFGYHIIKNNGTREGGVLTLEDNWSELESLVIRNKRLKIYEAWLESLRNDVYIDVKM